MQEAIEQLLKFSSDVQMASKLKSLQAALMELIQLDHPEHVACIDPHTILDKRNQSN